MKLKTKYIGLFLICLLFAIKSNAQEGLIGEIKLFAGNFAPRGWAFCDGQIMSISQNTALFSILGTIYGGDGRTTYALPDLRGRAPIGPRTGPGLSNYRQGTKGGKELNVLNSTQLPSHNHSVIINNNGTVSIPVNTEAGNEDEANPGGGVLANTGADNFSSEFTATAKYNASTITVQGISASTTNTGSNLSVDNKQPYLASNYIICLFGVYPNRQ
ncbi:phage tail protein [Tenacibaculum bernardetii]|uniref:phage tail protein n=1 Tax=Tenacibaculum bernardetii TaxID=3021375 RepID=UPI0023B0EC22|nr:tail fiber protein [Tenacibaculum bernardetii]